MGDVDRGHAQAFMQLGQGRAHRDTQLGIKVGQRLVHQERLRLAHDGPAHRDPLPLPAGERGRLALQVLLDAQHRGHLADPAPDLVVRQLALLEAERQILLHRHMRVKRVVLEHHRDVTILGRQVIDDLAADADRAGRYLLQPRDRPQRRGLAASRRPDQNHELAIADLQAELVDRLTSPGYTLLTRSRTISAIALLRSLRYRRPASRPVSAGAYPGCYLHVKVRDAGVTRA